MLRIWQKHLDNDKDKGKYIKRRLSKRLFQICPMVTVMKTMKMMVDWVGNSLFQRLSKSYLAPISPISLNLKRKRMKMTMDWVGWCQPKNGQWKRQLQRQRWWWMGLAGDWSRSVPPLHALLSLTHHQIIVLTMMTVIIVMMTMLIMKMGGLVISGSAVLFYLLIIFVSFLQSDSALFC